MEQQVDPGDNALAPTTRWKHHRDRGYSDVRICTWDRAGLFSKIAGALSAVGLNILSAQIFTRTDGVTYYDGLQLRIDATVHREQHELCDGGSVDWASRLLSDRREHLFTSVIGLERLLR